MQSLNKYKILGVLFYGYLHLQLVSCCKEKCTDASNPECENYNPCSGKNGNYASFTVYDFDGSGCSADWFCEDKQTEIKIDGNYFYNNNLRFKANYDSALTYEWQIGAGSYSGKLVKLGSMPDVGEKVPVRLIVTYAPTPCKSNGKTKDTMYQEIERGIYKIRQVWKGYDTDKPSEIYTLTFDTCRKFYPTINQWRTLSYMKDSRKSCIDTFYDQKGGFANSNKLVIVSERGDGINNCSGYYKTFSRLIDSTNNNIRIKYSYTPPIPGPEGFQYKTFLGQRIE